MKVFKSIIFIFLVVSCNFNKQKNELEMDANTQIFTEGTVGMIGDYKIMFSNIMIQDYSLEDGTTKQGPAASLSLPNSKTWQVVGVGSTFIVDNKKYEIIEITEDDPFGQVIVKL